MVVSRRAVAADENRQRCGFCNKVKMDQWVVGLLVYGKNIGGTYLSGVNDTMLVDGQRLSTMVGSQHAIVADINRKIPI